MNSLLLALAMLFCVCTNTQNIVNNIPLDQQQITQSIELTCIMGSIAQSEEYMQMLSAQPEWRGLIKELGAEDYSAPKKAILIKISDETVNMFLGAAIEALTGQTGAEMLDLSEEAYEMVQSRMLSSVPSIINAWQGVEKIAVSSMLTVNKTYQQHKDFSDNTYVVLIYDNYDSVTFFRNSGDNITSASTSFLFLNDEMKTAAEKEDMLAYIFGQLGVIDGIEIDYIGGDTIAEYRQ